MKTLTKFGLAAAAAFTFFATDVAAQAISTATVTVNPISKAPTGITAQISGEEADTSCSGNSILLTVSGGSLAPGADWKFYKGTIDPANEISGTGTTRTVTFTNSTTTNETFDILVRAEGGAPCSTNTSTASMDFTVRPLPLGTLDNPTICEGSAYELTFDATTPASNGPFKLGIFHNSTTDHGHVYSNITSGTSFLIDASHQPTTGANEYNLMSITDDYGCESN